MITQDKIKECDIVTAAPERFIREWSHNNLSQPLTDVDLAWESVYKTSNHII